MAVLQLCTLEQIKARGQITVASSDDIITSLICSVLPVFNMRFSREFMADGDSTRTFLVRNRYISFGGCDLRAETAVVLHPGEPEETTLVAGTDYLISPGSFDRKTGTYSALILSASLGLASTQSRKFGLAKLTITGTWGCFDDESDVPADINAAAVETVRAWMDRPSAAIASQLEASGMRGIEPATPSTWDIPSSAYRKMQPYNRNLGVW